MSGLDMELALFSDDQTLTRGQYEKARRTDPVTSKRAVSQSHAQGVEKAVLHVLNNHPSGLTADQIVGRLPSLYGPTIKTSIARLRHRDLVHDTGREGLSVRGRPSIVWAAS